MCLLCLEQPVSQNSLDLGEVSCTFVNCVLLLKLEIKKFLVPVHDLVLELNWNFMSCDLEKAIMQTAVADFLYKLSL